MRTADQPIARPIPTQDNTHTEKTLTTIHAHGSRQEEGPQVWPPGPPPWIFLNKIEIEKKYKYTKY
jgi:hypothetical protein